MPNDNPAPFVFKIQDPLFIPTPEPENFPWGYFTKDDDDPLEPRQRDALKTLFNQKWKLGRFDSGFGPDLSVVVPKDHPYPDDVIGRLRAEWDDDPGDIEIDNKSGGYIHPSKQVMILTTPMKLWWMTLNIEGPGIVRTSYLLNHPGGRYVLITSKGGCTGTVGTHTSPTMTRFHLDFLNQSIEVPAAALIPFRADGGEHQSGTLTNVNKLIKGERP